MIDGTGTHAAYLLLHQGTVIKAFEQRYSGIRHFCLGELVHGADLLDADSRYMERPMSRKWPETANEHRGNSRVSPQLTPLTFMHAFRT